MPTTAADVLVEGLIAWGVDRVFGIPGDGVNGVIEALRKKQDEIRFIQVRHEEAAAFMACAHAKFTGKLGCCLSTSGPGGIHLLNGLYDAKMDGQPVIAITGLQFHDLTGTATQQDVALDRLFMDVAAYNERIMGPAHVENVIELACRTAVARRQPVHVTMAVDHQSEPLKNDKRSERNLAHHVSNVQALATTAPAAEQLRRAADILNAGEKVTILAGPRRARLFEPRWPRSPTSWPRRWPRPCWARQPWRTTIPTASAASACWEPRRRRRRWRAATPC